VVLRQARRSGVHTLGPADLPAALDVLARDPVLDVFIASRVERLGLDPWRLGAQVWGYFADGRLDALCYSGANLVPVQADAQAIEAFAERAGCTTRTCASIVGEAVAVTALWDGLARRWGPARDVRPDQPVLVCDRIPEVTPDPGVRPVRPDEIDLLVPACIAMSTEEIGVSPIGPDGGASYRTRVADLVHTGRALARIEDGQVVFKAEIAAVSAAACQIQSVWVAPERRGERLSVPGMAAVVGYALQRLAPVAQLYVNAYNHRARRVYDRVGFRRIGTFASVLF
jgi:predicted GNAT family acetyltransferase